MKNVKALKDPYLRRTLGIDPNEHPSGPASLTDDELETVNAGFRPSRPSASHPQPFPNLRPTIQLCRYTTWRGPCRRY